MKDDELDALVTRLYRAAMSIKDTGWQELLKNAACSLSAAPLDCARGERGPALIAAVALTDTVLVLAEHARIEPMTLSKAIRKLEQARLLKRDASVADSRAMTVRLTATGRTLTQSAVVAIEQADEEFFGCLNDRELESYKRVVRALVAGNA